MGKNKNGKKNYNYKNKGKNDKFRPGKKRNNQKKNRYLTVKKNIERNKESEEILKRQQLAEIKYQKSFVKDESSDEEDEGPQEPDAYTQLMGILSEGKKEAAIESSSDESEDDEDKPQNEEELDSEMEDVEEEEENVSEEEGEDEVDDDQSKEDLDETDNEENATEDIDSSKYINPEDKEASGLEFLDDSMEHELKVVEEDLEEEFDSDVENEDKNSNKSDQNQDPFCLQLNYDLSPSLLEAVSTVPMKTEVTKAKWKMLENLLIEIPHASLEPAGKKKKTILGDDEVFASEGKIPELLDTTQLVKKHFFKEQVAKNLKKLNETPLTGLQTELMSIINGYQDFYYPHRTFENGEEIRLAYCTHALNHILKTRTKILHHNAKLGRLKGKSISTVPETCRDQGLVRPKVLIILPFRDSAYRVVNMLIDLLNPEERHSTMNYKRFVEEFTGQSIYFPKKNPKPEDFEQMFTGNTEDTFRLGISLNKKSMKLYAPFYASDILIASPLGLRLIIGAKGDKEREYDFLASIEVLILDQMELFLAQNWDHLLQVFDHMHLQPQSRQNTDFSRVRSWCLNGWSRFYRQTLLFSSYDLPEFRSLFNNRCQNYRGKVRTSNPCEKGSIRHVIVHIPQIFHRIEVKSLESSFDTRFEYFTNTILPQFKAAVMAHCMIYIPSYFDFVRIRNYFKKEELNFVQICEYTKDNKISKARTLFYHGGAHFMLYSERGHFFRRTRIKGIRHLIIYQPPTWDNFYPEMLNLMQESNQNPNDNVVGNAMTVTVLYTKYDLLQLQAIVNTEQAGKMFQSNKQTHMFINEK